MGVSSTARLPSLGAQSIPPLFSHLQHTSNAKVVARWSITIRSFRAVPVPTNAWPSPDLYDTSFARQSSDPDDVAAGSSSNGASSSGFSNQAGSAGGASSSGGVSGSSASGAPPLTKPRTMWQVWLSDHPGVVFVIVEDTGRSSRAKVWRDWEVSTKKWKREKRREIEAKKKKQERDQKKLQQEVEKAQVQVKDFAETSTVEATDGKEESGGTATAQSQSGAAGTGDVQPMDVDVVADSAKQPSSAAGQPSVSTSDTWAGAQQAEAARSTAAEPTAIAEEVAVEDDEVIEEAGPKPKLRLPSHTRYTVSAVTSSMSAMLTGLNLPPPHGAPVGTAGPGAWVPRGAAVSIEGLVLEINSQSLNALPGISPALASVSSTDDATTFSDASSTSLGGVGTSGGVDWRVRVGSVMGGGGRSAGAIVEAEFLPISTLLPTSKFMHDFLHSLFPPGLVPMPPPASALAPVLLDANHLRTGSRTASATGTPRSNNANLPGPNGNVTVASAPGSATVGSGFSYTIGGGATAPPNRTFNIPIVSDQLWEEVVPRSGEGWRRRIAKRSHQMKTAARVQRRQRRKAASGSTSAPQNGSGRTNPSDGARQDQDAFGWHTFGSDDDEPTLINDSDWKDENEDDLSSSESESEQALNGNASGTGAGLSGTAVTMQQADEDEDDDDDDRPLGAPIWSNPNARTSSAPNSAIPLSANPQPPPSDPSAVAKPKEDTVPLIFQGLRPDDNDNDTSNTDADGWTGIERGRRIAFQYVQMLRAEGII